MTADARASGGHRGTAPRAPPSRRHLLGLASSLPFIVPAGRVDAALARTAALDLGPVARPLPRAATMVIAGPAGGPLDRWARTLATSMAPDLGPGASIEPASTGAGDGVTGANGFGAEAAPDGRTVLLTPGQAAISWLVGDPRAKFDVSRWIPVIAATHPAVLVAGKNGVGVFAGRRVKVAVTAIECPDLAALAAVELLGGQAEPVLNGTPKLDALARGFADIALINARDQAALTRQLAGSDLRAILAIPALDPTGVPIREPGFPDLPHVMELYRPLRGGQPNGPMVRACRAADAAARLEFGLVLPPLTPAAMIAIWRRTGATAIAAPTMAARADEFGAELLAPPAAAATISAMAADTEALLALRYWLAARFGWRPG